MDFLIAIIEGIVGDLIANEIVAHKRAIAGWLVENAVQRLPESERDRYREEWLAHLDEVPGLIGQLRHALGCNFKAIQVELRNRPPRKPQHYVLKAVPGHHVLKGNSVVIAPPVISVPVLDNSSLDAAAVMIAHHGRWNTAVLSATNTAETPLPLRDHP